MPEDVISELENIVGSENMSTRLVDRIDYSTGAEFISYLFPPSKENLPIAVVRPADAHEVSEILNLANRKLFPVTVRGAGTGNAFKKPRRPRGVILSLDRMEWMEIFEKDGYVECGPATRQDRLNEFLSPYGYTIPPFCGGYRQCHFGGTISINTSGHSVDPYLGKVDRYILGFEVVLPTGKIIETGGRTLRTHAGPDLTKLFIGGEGLFGVIVKIRARLSVKPAEEKRAIGIFPSIYEAEEAVMRMYQEQPVVYPRWLEIFCEKWMEKACEESRYFKEAFARLGIDPKGAMLMMITDGFAPGEAQWKMEKILEKWKKGKNKHIQTLEQKEWELLEKGREIYRGTPHPGISMDPPLSKLVEVTKAVRSTETKLKLKYPEIEVCLFGHVGAPSLHPTFLFPRDWSPEKKLEAAKMVGEEIKWIYEKYACSMGEQGIFFPELTDALDWFRMRFGETYLDLLKNIKRVFDPNDILNPGYL